MKCLCVVISVQLLSSIVILSYNEENKVLRVHYITEYYKYDLNFSWDEKKSKEKKTHKEQNTGWWDGGGRLGTIITIINFSRFPLSGGDIFVHF